MAFYGMSLKASPEILNLFGLTLTPSLSSECPRKVCSDVIKFFFGPVARK